MKIALSRRLLSMAAILAATIHPAAVAAEPSLAGYRGPDRMERIVAAARKEGALSLYTSVPVKNMQEVIKPFEEKYGIKVTLWRAADDKVLQRALSEASAKRYEVDVIQAATPDMEALTREKLLLALDSPVFKDLRPGAVPKHREWAIAQITPIVVGYNTNLLKKEELPKSYRDLLDPKWKGKLGVEATDYDWFAAVSDHFGGHQLFKDIVAKNGVMVRKGHTLLGNMVIAGEVPLGLTLYNYMPAQAKRKGAPIDWFTLEPTLTFATAIGITRNAPHPNAALLFHEYMLTEGQRVMARLDNVPSNTKVDSPLQNMKLKFVDPDASLDNRVQREKAFLDVMGGK